MAERDALRTWRRRVGVMIAVLALASIGAACTTDEAGEPDPSLVPDEWKPVVVESVQFSVPDEWPVVTPPECEDSTYVVYLGIPGRGCQFSSFAMGVIADGVDVDPDFEIGLTQLTRVDDTVDLSPTTLETIHGLRATVTVSEIGAEGGAVSVKVLDEDVEIQIEWVDPDDADLALQIVDTIGQAPG